MRRSDIERPEASRHKVVDSKVPSPAAGVLTESRPEFGEVEVEFRLDVIGAGDGSARLASGAAACSAEPPPPPVPVMSAGPPSPPLVSPASCRRLGDQIVPFSNMRRRTEAHMARSKATSPHAFIVTEVDFESIERVRAAWSGGFKAQEGFSLTYLPFVVRATVDALRDFPLLNASIVGARCSFIPRSTLESRLTWPTRACSCR
jgi:pyruvate/2-oxoglutarate dehydrogenase complex dihydrolipoamide acyltransferase (E2) component